VIASLEADPEARAFLDEMERLGDVTRTVEPLALPDTSTFDVADAVMALVEEHDQKSAVTTPIEKKTGKTPPKKPHEKDENGSRGHAVSSLEVAREKRRRVGVVVATGLALAAGIALVMRSHPGEDPMKSASNVSLGKPVDSVPLHATPLTASGAPALPSTSEAALAAASASNVLGDKNEQGVEVDIADSTQTGVSVFYLPGSDVTSASAVVWIDESSGGKQ
jgi:hypothetical protein